MTMPLAPSFIRQTLRDHDPHVVVIHRDAFVQGQWFGAEQAAGGTMFEELQGIIPWASERQATVIFIDNGRAPQLHTEKLRQIGSLHFPSTDFFERVPEMPRRSAIYELAQKFGKNA